MKILILGGTAWLGREIAREALARGHAVTALARGESGSVPDAVTHVVADRSRPGAYAEVADRDWDAVVEISWQPAFVRDALAALGDRAAHWTLISSTSVYASAAEIGADESAATFAPLQGDRAERAEYGEAKAAVEQASRAAVDEKLLIVRPGLIGGPGDETGRSGAWVARAARAPGAPLLVPDEPSMPTQVVDVRDLVAFVVDSAERRLHGIVNAVGPVVPLGEWIEESRRIGGHGGELVVASSAWLLANGVEEFMGEESLALWLPDPDYLGFSARSGRAAEAEGLTHRPRSELLGDVLEWERSRGLDRPRRAGLSAEREAELLQRHAASD
ncbi:nucleoside-diphosphate-sugar epimerase [Microterricola gilva]|uniref:Nucleoside-diphosphate-sugar epimerase n=1 Tax=Microterricola gilva TaxID=393267 RepID=A0A4Q8AJG4_9MICO|nr:NAD-dependent epimerase/dehydratase family protein [Microterricola gilva]RZU63919.1 nucleoside-diphosphate-sugar epimerase [Microterricola gilva]